MTGKSGVNFESAAPNDEAAATAADLAYQILKDSGQLWRMESHRALVAQVKFGDAL